MLIDEPKALESNAVLAMVASVRGGAAETLKRTTGIYEIGHFGSSHYLYGYNHYPELSVEAYGVCDNVEQLLKKCPELEVPGRQFVVTLSRVRKSEQPAVGGWRWHKWGEYIGTQHPRHEYLHDEPDIEEVFCYHIYEKRKV